MSIYHVAQVVFGIDFGKRLPLEIVDMMHGGDDEDGPDACSLEDAVTGLFGESVCAFTYGDNFRGIQYFILGVPGSETDGISSRARVVDFKLEAQKVVAFREAMAKIGVASEPNWLIVSDRI